MTNLMENKVFLGGTCNDSTWREKLIPLLRIPYFNPVVKDWTDECQKEERQQKKVCKWHLYVITPRMLGCSVAEVIDSSNKNSGRTIFCILEKDDDFLFTPSELKSLYAVRDMVSANGAHICTSLEEIANLLNSEVHPIRCVLHVNTAFVREELQKRGYIHRDRSEKFGEILCIDSGRYFSMDASEAVNDEDYFTYIECGTNVTKFLAIAALNSTNDYLQWFVCDESRYDEYTGECYCEKGDWELCTEKTFPEYDIFPELHHKASILEITDHFKQICTC